MHEIWTPQDTVACGPHMVEWLVGGQLVVDQRRRDQRTGSYMAEMDKQL